jgi:N-acetylglucosaminyldiphosphoundecaprenol N-acetyl-beta-D-mannosaminyltransferase
MGNSIKNYSFYGLPVSLISEMSLNNFFENALLSTEPKIIYGYSLYSIYALKKIPEIFTLGSKSDLFLTDGRPFYWLCKLKKIPVSPGISIPECVMASLDFANLNGLKLMLIGAKEEVNLSAQNSLRIKYKGIKIVEGFHGYFNCTREKEIVEAVNKIKPDIILVGMSSPKKEKFVMNNVLSAKIIIPCGGMLDVLAGKTKMTPKWFKRRGLATLFRVAQEPRRLFIDRCKMIYFLLTNFFPLLIIKTILKSKNFSIPGHYLGSTFKS